MSNKIKHSGGPKTDKGKAISSRNSTTHGLTSRRWIDSNEQSLYDETVKEYIVDFDPQTHIEKVLISKLAECTIRLMRIQNTENAMFDFASSEAGHPEESIKSLDNNNTDPRLIEAVRVALLGNPKCSTKVMVEKINLMDEIDFQNLSDVSGWGYVEKHMPMTKDYILDKCSEEDLNLHSLIGREVDNSSNLNFKLELIGAGDPIDNKALSVEEIMKDSNKIQSTSLQMYLEQLSRNFVSDIKAR